MLDEVQVDASGDPRSASGHLEPQEFREQSFLGRPFDAYQNMVQIARCVRVAGRMRGVERPKVLELSRRPTQVEEYLPEAEVVHFDTHDANEDPILPNPVVLPFGDGEFDALLITDAYEHVTQDLRPSLVAEMVRVTRGVVLLGTPTADPIVDRFDRVVFDFIWGKYGAVIKPAMQHVKYGHQSLEEIEGSILRAGADGMIALPCNYIYRWIQQLIIWFDLQEGQPYRELYEPLNRVYNAWLSPYDYREPSFRYLIAVLVDPGIDRERFRAEMTGPTETVAYAREAEAAFQEVWRFVETETGRALREAAAEIERLQGRVGRLERELTGRVVAEGGAVAVPGTGVAGRWPRWLRRGGGP